MWKTGHSLIKDKMKTENAKFAGEMSGHIFFADDYYGYDDALYVGLRLLQILSNTNDTLSQLTNEIPKYYSTPEMRIDCKNCLLYTSPSPRDGLLSRMPSSA